MTKKEKEALETLRRYVEGPEHEVVAALSAAIQSASPEELAVLERLLKARVKRLAKITGALGSSVIADVAQLMLAKGEP